MKSSFRLVVRMILLTQLALCLGSRCLARQQEAGVEFNGPYASWVSVTTFGAVGDGIADDTTAIQDALNSMKTGTGENHVIYFPSGTYRITETIEFPDRTLSNGLFGKLIIGEEPQTTALLWDGAPGGDMFWLAGHIHTRLARLTFDGDDSAGIGLRVERDGYFGLWSTYVQINDCIFRGSDYGIYNTNRSGAHAMDDGYSILRCTFEGITQAGIRIDAGNAYNYWVRHCLFTDCQVGVYNTYGDFYVMQSRFERTIDTDIRARAHRAGGIRDNVSVDSNQFLELTSGQYVVKGNRVLDLAGTIAIDFIPQYSYTGLMAMDNVFHADHAFDAIQVQNSILSSAPIACIDNTYADTGTLDIQTANPLLSGNTSVSAASIDQTIPVLPAHPPVVTRPIIEVIPGDDVQTKINQAVTIAQNTPGERPVVHLAGGTYNINDTITIPANLPIKVVGDGAKSIMTWNGVRSSVKPLFLLEGPSRVTMQDVSFKHGKKVGDIFKSPIADILIDQADQVDARVYTQNSWLSGLFADRLVNANIDMVDYYSSNYGGWLFTTLKAVGAPTASTSRIAMFGGACIGDQVFAHVVDGGQIMMQDFWHEENDPMEHPWILAEGEGYQPGIVSVESGYIYQKSRDPILHARGYDGTFSLLANYFGGNSNEIEIVGPSAYTDIFNLLGGAEIDEKNTNEPGYVFSYNLKESDDTTTLQDFDDFKDWYSDLVPDMILDEKAAGVTDVRLHRIMAYYQNGWGVWVRPDAHDDTNPGVSVKASIWDAYDYNNSYGRFTFTRDTTDTAWTVDFVTEGATNLQQSLGTSITFPIGVAEVDLDVIPIEDGVFTGDRSIELKIVSGTGYSIGVPRQSERDRIVIHDTDKEQKVWFTSDAATISESANAPEGQTTTITFNRDLPYRDILVQYAIGGTASAGDIIQTLSGAITIPDGEYSVTLTLEALDDTLHEPSNDLVLTVQAGTGYDLHPDRFTTTTVTILDDDLIDVDLEEASDTQFIITRNGTEGTFEVPYRLTANGEIYEGIVYFVDGYDEAYVILPQETWQWTGPITVTLLPFTGSSLATLTIPDNAGRYWWAVTPTNVLAIDLELSQWTAQGTTAGDAVFAHVHQAPVDWLPANTPNNATSVAYDSVDDRLWVMVAFSSVNDDDQILWRIEDVSSATPTFVQHANFGIVASGKAFEIQLDANRDVLVKHGGSGSLKYVAHVKLDGTVDSAGSLDVISYSPTSDGGIWASTKTNLGQPGLIYWADVDDFPSGAGVQVIPEFGGNISAVGAMPELVAGVLGFTQTVAYAKEFALVDLVDTQGLIGVIGELKTAYTGASTRINWDPSGRVWIRPQENHTSGVSIDPAEVNPPVISYTPFRYDSKFSFDNDYLYLQSQNTTTLQRLGYESTAYEHIQFKYQGTDLLLNADGDPTGYHWYRLTHQPELPEITLSGSSSPSTGNLIDVQLSEVSVTQFEITRNGTSGALDVPYRLTAGGELYEDVVTIADTQSDVTVTLSALTQSWTGPITVSLLPFPNSTLTQLPVPDQASRYWWAVTLDSVVAIDLKDSQWTAQGTTAGQPEIVIEHAAPVDWLPSDTPSNATSVAYDPIDDRLWVLVAFSSVNDHDQVLWRIENVSTPNPTFIEHANFGSVNNGKGFEIQLAANRDVLLRYGGTGNSKYATHVYMDGTYNSVKGLDVLSFSPSPEGGVWAAISPNLNRPGMIYWDDVDDFPSEDGLQVINTFGAYTCAVGSMPALVSNTIGVIGKVTYSEDFALVDLIDTLGTLAQIGSLNTTYPAGSTRIYWDPLGHIWVRPRDNHTSGVHMNSLDATPTEVSNSQFVYSSRITFDNDYVYLHKENNATLQRMALDGTTYEHIEFEYQNSPLLRNADGDPTGYNWYRLTQQPELPHIELPGN